MNKIDVNKALTADELSLAQAFVLNYAREPKSPEELVRPMSEILGSEWADNKYHFYKAFGEKLILSKEIQYATPENDLAKMMDELDNDENSGFHKFKMAIYNLSKSSLYEDFRDHNCYKYANVFHYVYDQFFWNNNDLAANEYRGPEATIIPPNGGKEIKVQRGAKPVKLLGKIAEAFNIPYFEEFRLEHSRVLNTAKLKGELCISIHPLDYMTMSENDSNWASCMNWHQRGCYRRGTVEMMNSPYVVVAYLKAKDDMERFGYRWNNKKWRQLFVVTDEVVASVKAYPYPQNDLTEMVINWIAEVMNAAGADYDTSSINKYEYECGEGFYKMGSGPEDPITPVVFETDTMYNDFGCDVYHTLMFGKKWLEDRERLEFNYSGASQCMICGDLIDTYETDYSAEQLVCNKCGGKTERCQYCGATFYEDEACEVDGEILCPCCYESRTIADDITGERHLHNIIDVIHITDTPEYESDLRYYYQWGVATMYSNINSEAWLKVFPEAKKYERYGYRTRYYIDFNSCSEEAKEIIRENFQAHGMPAEDYFEALERQRNRNKNSNNLWGW